MRPPGADSLPRMNLAPPTHADADLDQPAAWPGWIGGLSIAFSSLGLLGSCCGMMGLASGTVVARMTGVEFPPPPRVLLAATVAGSLVGIALSIAQLVGGIGTLRNRSGGPRLLLRYATVSLVLTAVVLPVNVLMVRPGAEWGAEIAHAQLDFVEKNGGKVTAEMRAEAEAAREPTAFSYAGPVGVAALGTIFPIVLAVFLRKPYVRARWERWEA